MTIVYITLFKGITVSNIESEILGQVFRIGFFEIFNLIWFVSGLSMFSGGGGSSRSF